MGRDPLREEALKKLPAEWAEEFGVSAQCIRSVFTILIGESKKEQKK